MLTKDSKVQVLPDPLNYKTPTSSLTFLSVDDAIESCVVGDLVHLQGTVESVRSPVIVKTAARKHKSTPVVNIELGGECCSVTVALWENLTEVKFEVGSEIRLSNMRVREFRGILNFSSTSTTNITPL